MSRRSNWKAWVLAGAVVAGPVWAQAPAPKKDAAALSDADRAKRDASKVFSFIKFHAVRSAAPAPAPAATALAAAAPAAPRAPDRVTDAPTPGANAAPNPASGPIAAPMAAASAPAPTGAATAALADPAALLAAAPTAAGGAAPAVASVAAVAAPVAPAVQAQPTPEPEELVELALIEHVEPVVPARLQGIVRSGSVMVQFTVQPDGKTAKVFARPGGQVRLAQVAVKAVEQWRFAPIPEPRDVMVELAFKLD
ncbi:TonB family protein [Inhella crocodyli]|uniref:TonB family protein n=1 Tax=Inhella crocodyli TaxID=2499851 RepID=A0A437LLX7_9BURK|nr:TonB family protein [Inhella crocodyli]RVT86419.1 TonB family protein [Inhella crocodyli]